MATPYVLLQNEEGCEKGVITKLTGPVKEYAKMNDIPRGTSVLPLGETLHGGDKTYDTFAILPFSTINERAEAESSLYQAHNCGEQILAMTIEKIEMITTTDFIASFEQDNVKLAGDMTFDMDQDEYEGIIQSIIDDEIGKGEGSSFVSPRKCMGLISAFTPTTALSIYKRLLTNEYGCYWKFLFFTGDNYFIGASPERQIEVRYPTPNTRTVMMNPISGTFRKNHDETPQENITRLVEFLKDQKEINELFMVTDEELKMMSTMCSEGGNIIGPLLKEMSHLIHTEYLLEGQPREGEDNISLLRKSMFAPTVIGSPVGNACKVVGKYEKSTRSYYSSCVLLLGHDSNKNEFLDSAITIRTLEVNPTGEFQIRVGATLVNNSVATEEFKECSAKVKGVVSNLQNDRKFVTLDAMKYPEVTDELYKRNTTTSKFWMHSQAGEETCEALQGKKLVLSHNEDDFIYMLGHIMSKMGCDVEFFHFFEWGSERVEKLVREADICVIGPGPGDPTDVSRDDSKMSKVRAYVTHLLDTGKPFLAVCLGHQVLSHHLGFDVKLKERPTQGVQMQVNLYGTETRVGFYNAFYAKHDADKVAASPIVETSILGEEMMSTRGAHWCSFQFHPESILTVDGFTVIKTELLRLVGV